MASGWEIERMKYEWKMNQNLFDECTIKVDERGNHTFEYLNLGPEARATSIQARQTYGGGIGTVGVTGPNVYAGAGLKGRNRQVNLHAQAEASLAKVEATLGPLYFTANLNAKTGYSFGLNGFEAHVAGLGMRIETSGRIGLDTPFGSVGVSLKDFFH